MENTKEGNILEKGRTVTKLFLCSLEEFTPKKVGQKTTRIKFLNSDHLTHMKQMFSPTAFIFQRNATKSGNISGRIRSTKKSLIYSSKKIAPIKVRHQTTE